MAGSVNCFICIIHSKFDPFHFLDPIKGFCRHAKVFKSVEPEYKLVKTFLILNVVIIISTTIPFLSFLYYTPTICKKQQSFCLIFIADQIFIFISLVIGGTSCLNLKAHLKHLNHWLKVFQMIQTTLDNVRLKKRDIRKITFHRRFTIWSIILAAAINLILFLTLRSFDDLPWNIFRKICFLSAYNLHGYCIFDVNQKIKVMCTVSTSLKRSLKCSLQSRLYNFVQKKKVLILKPYFDLALIISRSYTFFSKSISLPVLLWNIYLTIFIILNMAVIFKCGDYDIYTLGAVEIRVLFTIIEMCHFYFNTEIYCRAQVSLMFFKTQ